MGSLSIQTELHYSHLQYPSARREASVVDNYHGTNIPDPYRWLEDPHSEETKKFVKEQTKVTEKLLEEECGQEREILRKRIKELFDYPRCYVPQKRGGRYFYLQNSGLQPHNVLYVQEGIKQKAEVLLDPNQLGKNGNTNLGVYSLSEDGEYLAYGLNSSGSDWVTIQVMRVKDKKELEDTLHWIKFSNINWTHDGKGFFYCRFPAPTKEGDAGTETSLNLHHQLYYHFLGTDQSEDILCWTDPSDPKYIFEAKVTSDGKYCLLFIEKGCAPVNKLYYCDLASLPKGPGGIKKNNNDNSSKHTLLPFISLVDNFEASYIYVTNDDTQFTFLTNKDASKNKLVRVDIKDPNMPTWMCVIEESKRDVIESVHAVNGNQMVVSYMSDVKHKVEVRDLKSGKKIKMLPLDIGTVNGISCNRQGSELFIGFTNFLNPGIIYWCDLSTEVLEMNIFREIAVSGFNQDEFEVKQVFVPTKNDTEKIPMFILSKKNIVLNGSHPVVLYGYGGFNFNITPSFNVNRVVLARDLGVVFCVANIRGGGEYGEEWHKAGSLSKKQNCFDDFIAAAEYLLASGYTNPQKICIEGASNGGLLVAACMNQRPDLFGCALAHVGVMDMLRFHKFTIGHAWTTEYGCSDKEEEFNWLIKYSPLHNVKRPWEAELQEHNIEIKKCQYPSVMLLTADHDNRVVPLHSLKLLATMQYVLCKSLKNSPQTNPIIARIASKEGHCSCGRSTQKMIDEAADRYSFMARMLGISWIFPKC